MPIFALKILKNACTEDVLFSCSISSFSWSPLHPFARSGEVDRDSLITESLPDVLLTIRSVLFSLEPFLSNVPQSIIVAIKGPSL